MINREVSALFGKQDHYHSLTKDDILNQLLALPNAIVTGHQALLTDSALRATFQTVFRQMMTFFRGDNLPYEVKLVS